MRARTKIGVTEAVGAAVGVAACASVHAFIATAKGTGKVGAKLAQNKTIKRAAQTGCRMTGRAAVATGKTVVRAERKLHITRRVAQGTTALAKGMLKGSMLAASGICKVRQGRRANSSAKDTSESPLPKKRHEPAYTFSISQSPAAPASSRRSDGRAHANPHANPFFDL